MRGQNADTDTWTPIDLGFETLDFPVVERYELEDRFGEPTIVATGREVRRWAPAGKGWASELVALADTTPTDILTWTREYGLIGLRPRAREESIPRVQRALRVLGQTIAAIEALGRWKAMDDVDFGALYDPNLIAAELGIEPFVWADATPAGRQRLMVVDLVARTIQVNLGRLTTVGTALVRDDDIAAPVRIVPRLIALTPLGLAWAETFVAAHALRVSIDPHFPRRDPRPPSICPVCKVLFRARRSDQYYCSPRCRWLANKRAQRGIA